MRQIKFRGQLSHNKQIVFGSLIITSDGQSYIIPSEVIEPDGHHLRIDSDLPYWVAPETVGQFTGLLDKNGKEIWEGDIVETFTNYHGKEGIRWSNSVIIWNEHVGSYQISYKNIDGHFVSDYFALNKYFVEIIGNIYENPELLSPK